MNQDGRSDRVIGVIAALAGACCALPVIAAGAFSAAAGAGLGSWLLVALGVAVVGFGFWQARRHAECRLVEPNVPVPTEGR